MTTRNEATQRLAAQRKTASDVSQLYRDLNVLSRRERIESRADTLRLAELVLDVDRTKQKIASTTRLQARGTDRAARDLVDNFEFAERELIKMLTAYSHDVGSTECLMNRIAWAKRVRRRHREEAARRKARQLVSTTKRSTATKRQPTATRKARPPRAGQCTRCSKRASYISTSGMCNRCIDALVTSRR